MDSGLNALVGTTHPSRADDFTFNNRHPRSNELAIACNN